MSLIVSVANIIKKFDNRAKKDARIWVRCQKRASKRFKSGKFSMYPEQLPPEEDVKKVERRLAKEDKKAKIEKKKKKDIS